MGDADPRDAWVPKARTRHRDPERIAEISRAQDALVDAGDLEAADRMLASWIAGHAGEDTRVARLERARVLFWRGRPEKARELLEQLHAEDPGDGWVASFLGQLSARYGEHARARALFEAARERDPGNHEARLFLGGDDLGDALRARRMITHGILPPRGCIEFAELCAALDFRRGRRSSWALGELTQASLDRANLLMDLASVGDDVEAELSIRADFARAERIVLYTSHALGDTLLGLSVLDALSTFFRFHPALLRPIDVVSPYAPLLAGLSDRYPLVQVLARCAPRDPDEALAYADDLRGRTERTLALVGSAPQVTSALAAVAEEEERVVGVVDILVDRYTRDLVPWQSVVAPRRRISSYPARLHRMLEIMLGCKLAERPFETRVTLPSSPEIEARRELLLRRHGLRDTSYDCVIESASKRSKVFAPALLRELFLELARAQEAIERATGRRQRIVFSCDSKLDRSFSFEVALLPDEVRARIVTIDEDLVGMAAILIGAETAISTDTGLAHLASALGRPTVIIYSVADPWLWCTGAANVRAIYAPEALEAHLNLTPVNMQEWESSRPLMADSLTVRDLLDAWRRVRTPSSSDL